MSKQSPVTEKRKSDMLHLAGIGWANAEIAQWLGVSRQAVHQAIGSRDHPKRVSRHFYARPGVYERAVAIAKGLGLVHLQSKWKGHGSIGRLVEQIGAGNIICEWAPGGPDATTKQQGETPV